MPDVTIHELSKKMAFLRRNKLAIQILGHRRNSHASMCLKLSEFAGREIKRETLRDQIAAGKLSSDMQRVLADALRFSPAWAEWNDPQTIGKRKEQPRFDTAEEFERKYVQTHAEGADQLPRLKGVLSEPWSINHRLASLQMFPHTQGGSSTEWPVGIELVCQPADVGGVRLAVKRCVVQMDCGKARIERVLERKGSEEAGLIIERKASKVVVRASGPDQRPLWDIESSSGPIAIFSLEEFCSLHGIPEGNVVETLVQVFDKDFVTAETEPTIQQLDPDESIVRPDGSPLGPARRQILKQLAVLSQKQIPNQEIGSAVLCRHVITFQTDDTDQD